jgi:tryptophanyl-tRNA synthetase
MSATTDSLQNVAYDPEKQPGISNLLQILALLTNQSLDEVIQQHGGQTQYGPFKETVAAAVQDFLADFQARLANIDDNELFAKIEASEAILNATANETLLRAQKAIGLRA